MAKQSKVSTGVEKAAPKKSAEKSVEEIEEDLQLPESSDEASDLSEEESGEELSAESEEEDNNLEGLEDEVEIEIEEDKSKGHSVNKVLVSQDNKSDDSNKKQKKRGIIYIGRIPHGFYEAELKKYFEQFGNIINLRLSRNKKSGKSKHYGFIEFGSYEVAKVAQETMNNYLLFGHLLKVELVESGHADLFKNANRRFTAIEWNKISKQKNDKPKSREQWGKLVEVHENHKLRKQKELKEKGFEFDLNNI